MAMTRSTFSSKLFEEGLREVFFDALDMRSLVYPSIYEEKTSNKRQEVDHTVAGISMINKKSEGVPITYEDFVDGYDITYVHSTYGKGIRITEELQEDELYGIMNKRTTALANATRYRLEYDHASLFNNASTTSVFTGGDSLALLSTAHTLAATPGTTVSNYVTSDLSVSAIETALVHFRTMVNDRNLLVAIEPSILLIPPQLEKEANEILGSNQAPYTGDNEINYLKGKLTIKVWPFLTDTNGWFILGEKKYGAPITFKRRPVTFGRDGDFDTGDIKMKVTTRYSFGFSDWRWCYGSTGST